MALFADENRRFVTAMTFAASGFTEVRGVKINVAAIRLFCQFFVVAAVAVEAILVSRCCFWQTGRMAGGTGNVVGGVAVGQSQSGGVREKRKAEKKCRQCFEHGERHTEDSKKCRTSQTNALKKRRESVRAEEKTSEAVRPTVFPQRLNGRPVGRRPWLLRCCRRLGTTDSTWNRVRRRHTVGESVG